MCKVQRVTNSCGHRNDHVLLVCHIAKPVSPPLSPQSHSAHESDFSTSDPLCNGLYEQRHFLEWPIGHPYCNMNPNSSNSDPSDSNGSGSGSESDKKVTSKGFHACTQPYCKYASIRELKSPKGFKCMVDGCGCAD